VTVYQKVKNFDNLGAAFYGSVRGHSIYKYIFSISGKICVISIFGKKNLNSEKNNFVFWKEIFSNYEETRICAAEMAVRYAALCACRKVHT